jgi:peptidyl-prolyl cis-trans isomerase D
MLQVFRKHAYSWGTRALLWCLIAAFVVFFGGGLNYFAQVKPVASVDCYTYFHLYTWPGCRNILSDEVDHEAGNIRKAVQNTRGPDAQAILQNVNLREMAVESLIEQIVVEREAHRIGLKVSDDDLAKAIASQAVFQENGRFNPERYVQILRDNGISPTDFESETRGKILADTLRRAVTSAIQVSPDEARAEFNRFGEKLSLAYIEFPAANFAKGKPTDKEIADFYQDNKETFREPERIKIDFIRYDPLALAPKEPPSDASIQEYYEQNLKSEFSHPEKIHVRHILIAVAPDASAAEKAAAKAKAQELLQKIKNGASFTELAKDNSDDPGSKQNGGDLGFISKGELVKPFEEVAFTLKPGELGLAETQFGYHVLQVEEVKGATVESIEQARPRIVTALKEQEGEKLAHQDLDQDIAAAGEGRELKSIAAKRGLVAVETPYFAENESIKGAEDDPGLVKEAFTLQPGETRPITQGGAIYLIKLIDRKATRIPPLSEIKDKVANTLLQTRAQVQAKQAADTLLKQIKSPEAFDAVAESQHLQVKTTGDFTRASGNLPGIGSFPEAVQAAAATPAIPGVIDHVMENGGNAYLFKVVSRTPPSDAEWKMVQAQFTSRFLQQKQEDSWINFVSDLKRKSAIVVHSDLIGNSTSNS